MKRERFNDVPDVDLRTAGHTNMKIWQQKAGEFLQKIKDLSAGGWEFRSVGTFVETIQDKINCALVGKRKHFLQASGQCAIVGLTRAIVMCLIEAGEYVATRIRMSRKLNKEGGE